MKRILSLFLLCAALLAAADRWTFFGYTGQGSKASYFYYDASSLRYRASDNGPNDYASIWIKYTEPSGGFYLAHEEMHYTTRRHRLLSLVRYNTEGEVTSNISGNGEWTDVVPDSILDALMHQLWRF